MNIPTDPVGVLFEKAKPLLDEADYVSLKTPDGHTLLFKEPHECPRCHAMTAWFYCGKFGENRCWLCAKENK